MRDVFIKILSVYNKILIRLTNKNYVKRISLEVKHMSLDEKAYLLAYQSFLRLTELDEYNRVGMFYSPILFSEKKLIDAFTSINQIYMDARKIYLDSTTQENKVFEKHSLQRMLAYLLLLSTIGVEIDKGKKVDKKSIREMQIVWETLIEVQDKAKTFVSSIYAVEELLEGVHNGRSWERMGVVESSVMREIKVIPYRYADDKDAVFENTKNEFP